MRVNVVAGPLVALIGLAAAVVAVILALTTHATAFLALFIPAVLAMAAGSYIFWGARRSRLAVDGAGFTWAGFFGREHSVRWEQLHHFAPPPPGDRRGVLTAVLRDGAPVPVRSVWVPPQAIAVLGTTPDLAVIQQTLFDGHRRWLAGHR